MGCLYDYLYIGQVIMSGAVMGCLYDYLYIVTAR